jgi:hypothetical protein
MWSVSLNKKLAKKKIYFRKDTRSKTHVEPHHFTDRPIFCFFSHSSGSTQTAARQLAFGQSGLGPRQNASKVSQSGDTRVDLSIMKKALLKKALHVVNRC